MIKWGSLVFSLCFLFLGDAYAQNQFKAGLIAGIVGSQIDGDGYAGYNKAGLQAGAFVSSKISKNTRWSAMFEITYIQKGSRKIPHPDQGDFVEYKCKLDYVEVPAMVKYDFSFTDSTGKGRLNFGVFGGIAVGALVNSEESDAFGILTGGTPFKKAELSYVLGLSYSLSQHIGFEIRTQYSVLPVRDGGTSIYYPSWTSNILRPGYYNNLLVFSARYRF